MNAHRTSVRLESPGKAPAAQERPGAWTDLYRRPIVSNSTPRIRSLRPGEPVPDSQPRRYPASSGYIRLRWKVGIGQYVETYEHRVFDGYVTEAEHVHHIDHDPTNNALDNLLPTTIPEHYEHHRTVDRQMVVSLYGSGLSTLQVADRLDCDHSTVYRALVAEGVQPRSISESLTMDLDSALIARLHRRGVRVRRIAKALGVSPQPVHRIVAELGLPRHRDGRPTNAEIEDAKQALREEGLS